MNAREEQERASDPYPQGELESPFQEGEIFVEEAEADWEAHLTVLEAESPFRHAFEQSPTMPIESEEPEEEYVAEEEWNETEDFLLDESEVFDNELLADPEENIEEFDENESYNEDEDLRYVEREGLGFSNEDLFLDEEAAFSEGLLTEVQEGEGSDYLDEMMDVQEAPACDESFFPALEEEQATGAATLRARIVEVAKQEWEKWDRGAKYGTDPAVSDYLQTYYLEGVKRRVARSDLQDIKWHKKHPWSAVFISYVMAKAGAGDAFFNASAHTKYVAAAKKNALAGEASKFQAFEISTVKPEISDLVCRDRARKGQPCNGTNFATVDKGGISHCDIVVEVFPDYIVTLGGNTSQEFPDRGKGGNTVGQRTIKLNAQGFVEPKQSRIKCKYFAIVKPPAMERLTPASSSSADSGDLLPTWLSKIVKSGRLTLQAASAILTGQRDVNTLTNMIFYARHPDLPVGYKIKPHEKQLAKSWVRIRDDVVKSLLDKLATGVVTGSLSTTVPASSPTSTNTSTKLSPRVIAAVEQYRSLVDAAAAKYGVDSALIRGVIAAESGGNKDLVAKSGYTGLMQADKGESQKQPAISIDAGTKKLRDFRRVMEGVLKERNRRYDQLPQGEQLRLLVLSYNAGPVTVAKALQYAADAGNPERWLDAEHYKRALLFTGAYSLSQAASSCLKGVSPAERASRIREAQKARLAAKKGGHWRKRDDPPPWSSIMTTLPPFLVCAIDFKHRNAPKYAARILAYQNAFLRR